jgi:hypothetical protein
MLLLVRSTSVESLFSMTLRHGHVERKHIASSHVAFGFLRVRDVDVGDGDDGGGAIDLPRLARHLTITAAATPYARWPAGGAARAHAAPNRGGVHNGFGGGRVPRVAHTRLADIARHVAGCHLTPDTLDLSATAAAAVLW